MPIYLLLQFAGALNRGRYKYVSESDRALKISRRIHGYPRLGEAGEYPTVLPGIETIDVSALGDFRPSGHLYHFCNPDVVADLTILLGEGQPADGRSNLESTIQNDIAYWRLMPKEEAAQMRKKVP